MELDFKMNFLANSQASPEVSTASLKTAENAENKTFESTLREKRKETENEKNSEPKETGKIKDRKRPEKKGEKTESHRKERPEAEETTERGEARKTEEAAVEQVVCEAVKVEETPEIDEAPVLIDETKPAELTEEQTGMLIGQIAEVLGVSPERITEALEKLEIEPEQLIVSENMNKLVMEVKGIDEPAKLLTEPEIAETFRDLRKIVSETLVEAGNSQPEEATPAAEALNITKDSFQKQAATTQNVETAETNTINAETAETAQKVEKTEKAEKTETAGASEKTEKTAQTGEVAPEEETLEDGEKPQPAQPESKERIQAHNPQNTGTGAEEQGRGFSGSNGQAQKEAAKLDDSQSTPVIIQKGDETVVEIGGRTVSRSIMRPQTQNTDVLNQIIEKMKIELKPGATEMKISLRPDELGSVTVKLVSEKGVVTAEIVTENSKVKELVEEKLDMLRESLKEQGVEVGGLSVSVGQQENDEKMMRFMREQSKSHARMRQIISRLNGEETPESINYANEANFGGYTVDYSA